MKGNLVRRRDMRHLVGRKGGHRQLAALIYFLNIAELHLAWLNGQLVLAYILIVLHCVHWGNRGVLTRFLNHISRLVTQLRFWRVGQFDGHHQLLRLFFLQVSRNGGRVLCHLVV